MSLSPRIAVSSVFSRKSICSAGPAALLIAFATTPADRLKFKPTEHTKMSAYNEWKVQNEWKVLKFDQINTRSYLKWKVVPIGPPSHSRYLESITEPDCPLTINNGNDELELKYILLGSFTSVRTTILYDNFFSW